MIKITLAYTNNNRARAAEILGIDPKTLYNKLKERSAHRRGVVACKATVDSKNLADCSHRSDRHDPKRHRSASAD